MINVRTIAQETSLVFSFFIDFTSRNNIRGEDAVRLLNKKIPPRQGDFIFFHKCSNVTTTRSIEGIAIFFYKWIFYHSNVGLYFFHRYLEPEVRRDRLASGEDQKEDW